MNAALLSDAVSAGETWSQVGGMFAAAGFAALLIDSVWRRHPARPPSYVGALAATLIWLLEILNF